MRADGSDKRPLFERESWNHITDASGGFTRQPVVFTPELAEERLYQYVPRLMFDAGEESSPLLEASSLTDNREPHSEQRPFPLPPEVVTNRLCIDVPCEEPASIVAGTHELGLNFLNHPDYADGTDSADDHFLYAAGDDDDQADDAYFMAAGTIGGVLYGRVHHDGDETYLQYWLFYYFNGAIELSAGLGPHVGDWELVQIRLRKGGVPDGVTFAYHEHAGHCDLDGAMDTLLNDYGHVVPVVYVASNSHASYPSPGEYDVRATANDEARGDSTELPELDPQIATTFSGSSPADALPTWLRWPGRWGETDDTFGESPEGPAHQESWEDPSAWIEGANGCQTPDGP
jgi:Vacuolar protein sorting-associated protein 62